MGFKKIQSHYLELYVIIKLVRLFLKEKPELFKKKKVGCVIQVDLRLSSQVLMLKK